MNYFREAVDRINDFKEWKDKVFTEELKTRLAQLGFSFASEGSEIILKENGVREVVIYDLMKGSQIGETAHKACEYLNQFINEIEKEKWREIATMKLGARIAKVDMDKLVSFFKKESDLEHIDYNLNDPAKEIQLHFKIGEHNSTIYFYAGLIMERGFEVEWTVWPEQEKCGNHAVARLKAPTSQENLQTEEDIFSSLMSLVNFLRRSDEVLRSLNILKDVKCALNAIKKDVEVFDSSPVFDYEDYRKAKNYGEGDSYLSAFRSIFNEENFLIYCLANLFNKGVDLGENKVMKIAFITSRYASALFYGTFTYSSEHDIKYQVSVTDRNLIIETDKGEFVIDAEQGAEYIIDKLFTLHKQMKTSIGFISKTDWLEL